jgi:hypothetical protein
LIEYESKGLLFKFRLPFSDEFIIFNILRSPVAYEKLRIFISGKQGELDNERAIVHDLVEELGFEAVCSESHSASELSVEAKFLQDVKDSDILVGIFGFRDSRPSRKECRAAKSYGKPILLFVKEFSRKRKPTLENFLKEMRRRRTGVVYDKFRLVTELKSQVHDAIIESITINFRKAFTGVN